MSAKRECGELLYNTGSLYAAVCTQPWGTEHSHADLTATEAVQAGLARLTPGYVCDICRLPIEGDDIDVRHTADNGEDLHAACCEASGQCSRAVLDQCPTCGHDRYGWGPSPVYFGNPPWCPYDGEDDHTIHRPQV